MFSNMVLASSVILYSFFIIVCFCGFDFGFAQAAKKGGQEK